MMPLNSVPLAIHVIGAAGRARVKASGGLVRLMDQPTGIEDILWRALDVGGWSAINYVVHGPWMAQALGCITIEGAGRDWVFVRTRILPLWLRMTAVIRRNPPGNYEVAVWEISTEAEVTELLAHIAKIEAELGAAECGSCARDL